MHLRNFFVCTNTAGPSRSAFAPEHLDPKARRSTLQQLFSNALRLVIIMAVEKTPTIARTERVAPISFRQCSAVLGPICLYIASPSRRPDHRNRGLCFFAVEKAVLGDTKRALSTTPPNCLLVCDPPALRRLHDARTTAIEDFVRSLSRRPFSRAPTAPRPPFHAALMLRRVRGKRPVQHDDGVEDTGRITSCQGSL